MFLAEEGWYSICGSNAAGTINTCLIFFTTSSGTIEIKEWVSVVVHPESRIRIEQNEDSALKKYLLLIVFIINYLFF